MPGTVLKGTVPKLLGFLAPRAAPGVERVDGDVWRRALTFGKDEGVAAARWNPRTKRIETRVGDGLEEHAPEARAIVRRVFDLDADPERIDRELSREPSMRRSVKTLPGVRVPGAVDPFEIAVRAILGQQVSVRAATTLAGRLVALCGRKLRRPADGLTHLFPSPEAVAAAPLEGLGLPGNRARALRGLAETVAGGAPLLDPGVPLETFTERLMALKGIGPWTAHYVALRCGFADAFPGGDLVLKRHAARAERWRPWRAYAAMRLWLAPAEPET